MFAGQMHFPARRMKGKEASPKVLLPVFGQADWDFLAPTGCGDRCCEVSGFLSHAALPDAAGVLSLTRHGP